MPREVVLPDAEVLRERCIATTPPAELPKLGEELDTPRAEAASGAQPAASGAQPDDGTADASSGSSSRSSGSSGSSSSSSSND